MTTKANCLPRLPQVFDGATKILSAMQLWTAAFCPKVCKIKTACQVRYAEKLEAAKQYLGERWVLSPQYNSRNNPAHTCRNSYHLRNVRKTAVVHERI